MSADNWGICPKCVAAAEAEYAALQAEATEAYGKLPIEEFDALRERASVPLDTEKCRTFREDYEFWGSETGVIHVSYSGHCSVCRTGLDFKSEHPIELKS